MAWRGGIGLERRAKSARKVERHPGFRRRTLGLALPAKRSRFLDPGRHLLVARQVGERRQPPHAAHRAGVARRARHFLVAPEAEGRSEEHTSELQSLMRNSYAVSCVKQKINPNAASGVDDILPGINK